MLERIRECARKCRAILFPRPPAARQPELVGLLKRAKLSGQATKIVTDIGGYAHAEPDRAGIPGVVTFIDERVKEPVSRCISGMQPDGSPADFERLDLQPIYGLYDGQVDKDGKPVPPQLLGTVGERRRGRRLGTPSAVAAC